MLGWTPSVRVFLATKPADMRRLFDGLAALVSGFLGQDPLSGHLFVFRNKRGDRVKILYWDRSSSCFWHKRLEERVFRLPATAGPGVKVEASELTLLLEGMDLDGATKRKRLTPARE